MIMDSRKIALIISLISLWCLPVDNICVSVPRTFFYTKVKLCTKILICHEHVVDGCLEGKGFTRVYINSQVKVIRKEAFRNLIDVESITFLGANVSNIEPGAFSSVNNLSAIFLVRNNIRVIHTGIFSKLPISFLHLINNKITHIEENAFADMDRLYVLKLKNNYLDRIESKWFSRTTNIVRLVLTKNELTTLDIDVFSQFTKLEYLELDYNKIHTINGKLSPNVKLVHMELTGNELTDVSFLIGTSIDRVDVGYNNISVGDDFVRATPRSMITKVVLHPNPWLCACLRRIEKVMLKYEVELIRKTIVREDKPFDDVPVCVELKIKRDVCDGVDAQDVEESRIEYFKNYRYY